jgi:DNA polymerase I-like protein with 3'-5' exonuclease and polymerase domains
MGFARGYGEKLSEEGAKELKEQWLMAWPEATEYFRWVRQQLELPLNDKDLAQALEGVIDEENLEKYTIKIPTGTFQQLFVGRFRGRCRFTVACNTMFQGLGADGAKEALWRVQRLCYSEPSSVLYGVRPVAFVHDEILAEVCEERAHAQAFELAKVMVEGCNIYLPDVPVRCTPALGKFWSKSLEAVFDGSGRLQPYDLAQKRKQKVYYEDGQPVNWAA